MRDRNLIPDMVLKALSDEELESIAVKLKAERERRTLHGVVQKAERIRQLCEEINDQGFEIIFKSAGNRIQYDPGSFETLVIRIDD